MADLDGSSSVHLSSETDIDPCCEPCGKLGRLREPVGYCPKCIEFYCQTCLDIHSQMGITASHKIRTGDDMPKSLADKPVKYQLCDVHDGEHKDRFCFDHGIIVCGICSLKKHEVCEVKHVKEAYRRFNFSAEKMTFCNDVELLISYANVVKKSVGDNTNKLETDSKQILTEKAANRDKMIKQIEEGYQSFSTDVKNKVREQMEVFSDSQLAVDRVVSDLSRTLQSLQRTETRKQNELKQFLDLQAHAETVRLCQDEIKCLHISIVQCHIEYNPNKAMQPLVDSRNKFGEISIKTKPFHCETSLPDIEYPYTRSSEGTDVKVMELSGAASKSRLLQLNLKELDKIDVKVKNDREDCYISGLDVTVDGNILLADFKNSKIKLFSPAGQLLSSLILPAKPEDATVINGSDAAVSMEVKQIGIIDITLSRRLSLKHTIKTKNHVWSVANYNNNLVITCGESDGRSCLVQMIDMRGNVIWAVTRDIHGNNLFNRAVYVTTRSNKDGEDVIATDFAKHTITVLNAGSGKVQKVCDVKGAGPRGITVDNNGNIYVCYRDTGEICVWSGDMEEQRCLVSRSEELYSPTAIACDHGRRKLFVSNSETENVRFIHCFQII